ncbi:MAG: hypothetical protein WCO98_12240, partial [bacterium]
RGSVPSSRDNVFLIKRFSRSDKIKLKNTTPFKKSVAVTLIYIIIPVHRGSWGQIPYHCHPSY